jgi:hypothetical protein
MKTDAFKDEYDYLIAIAEQNAQNAPLYFREMGQKEVTPEQFKRLYMKGI